ncbi:NAD(P)-dependent oxidoreductase [Psychrobacter sp. FDAARGOS_221]|uniref:NAD(P)-dependent oxidoreductase n=1 Tax=Psychrobacter sp. FDAARGOS_221 TaxID=1975705 RepID=UPI000BB5787A|nr:NAD(P)-binding oxidoreductase [Psychrobacter sp. FDAARGOS_221]PNK60937.1 NAD(P)-dependent oxidoreductase [Psychrobacter sp. FDAARGOS_221]
MNILVIGASGRVGSELVQQLLDKNHTVTGTSRDNKPLFDNPNYTHLALDLTADKEAVARQVAGNYDAVYFTAGSGGKDVLGIDLHGAVKTMQAAQLKGLSRYIMLSAVFSLDTTKWTLPGIDQLKDYYIAKHYADQWLIHNSRLDYTIVQAGALKEREPTGKIAINNDSAGENAIKDVAATLASVLTANNTIKKVFSIQNGDTKIDDAVATVNK